MKNKIYFSEQLQQHFRFTENGIICEDKVIYTNEEIELIKKSNIDIKIIHAAKLKFDATIINQDELNQLNEKYKNYKSNYEKAIEYASKLIKDGKSGYEATHIASEKYSISASAIGRALGGHKKK